MVRERLSKGFTLCVLVAVWMCAGGCGAPQSAPPPTSVDAPPPTAGAPPPDIPDTPKVPEPTPPPPPPKPSPGQKAKPPSTSGGGAVAAPDVPSPASTNTTTVRVFFGTDRRPITVTEASFANEPTSETGRLSLG